MKPYPTYKDSGQPWLGPIPEHWKLTRAKWLFDEVSEKNHPDKPLLSATQDKGVYPRELSENRVMMPMGELDGFKLVRPGEFVISLRSFEGGLEHSAYEGLISPAYTVLRRRRQLNDLYFKYLLKSDLYVQELNTAVTGIRDGQSIRYKDFGEARLPFPKLPEQAAIVAYLDRKTADIERFITKKRQLIALLNEQKAAIINQAIAKGLNPDVPMKASGVDWLGDVPAHWDVAPLYARYQVQLGKMLDAQRITGNHLAPYLRNTDVQWDSINIVDLPQMDFDADDRNKFSLRQGDLLVCEGGAVGRTAVWRSQLPECYYQKALHRLRPLKPKDYPPFFCQIMFAAANQEVFSSNSKKATIDHLPADKFRRYRFPFPPRQEQEAIYTFISSESKKIGIAISKIEHEIELIQEYRTALISNAVTGKIDVRETENA